MSRTFYVPPRGTLAIIADALAYPVMTFLAPRGETPQLTHFWNNIRYAREVADRLDMSLMVFCAGDPSAVVRRKRWDVRFHLGGWREYVVLEPDDCFDTWNVGWRTENGAGVSQIPIRGRVRMLVGSEDVEFFGVRASTSKQIGLNKLGRGRLGDRGPYRHVPLH